MKGENPPSLTGVMFRLPMEILFLKRMVCFCVTDGVKLLAQIQLRPTQQQAHLLRETIEQANAACTYTSDDAWAKQQFGHYRLHKVNYINGPCS